MGGIKSDSGLPTLAKRLGSPTAARRGKVTVAKVISPVRDENGLRFSVENQLTMWQRSFHLLGMKTRDFAVVYVQRAMWQRSFHLLGMKTIDCFRIKNLIVKVAKVISPVRDENYAFF